MTEFDGRYIVARHWHRWSVQDQAHNPPRVVSRHDSKQQAQAAADRRNLPPQRVQQASLFDPQEVQA